MRYTVKLRESVDGVTAVRDVEALGVDDAEEKAREELESWLLSGDYAGAPAGTMARGTYTILDESGAILQEESLEQSYPVTAAE